MKSYIPYIILVLLTIASCRPRHDAARQMPRIGSEEELTACIAGFKKTHDPALAEAIMDYCSAQGMDEKFDMFADSLMRENDALSVPAGIRIARKCLMEGLGDSAYSVMTDTRKKIKNRDLKNLSRLNELEADYLLNYKRNYPAAMDIYKQNLEIYSELEDVDNEMLCADKIAHLYMLKGDTSGHAYALRAIRLAGRTNSPYYRFSANLTLAQTFMKKKMFDSALAYSRQAIQIAERDSSMLPVIEAAYSITGDAYSSLGLYGKADSSYAKAFETLKYAFTPYVAVELYQSYGKYLFDTKRYSESNKIYKTGYDYSKSYDITRDDHHFLLGISKTYTALGQKDSALKYYRLYHRTYDSLFGNYTEKEFNSLYSDYESLKLANTVQKKELQISNLYYIIGGIIIIFIMAILIAVYSAYKKKDSMYGTIVEQYRKYQKKIEELNSKKQGHNAKSELFDNIERLMSEDKIYRNPELSLDMLAEMLKSNRTYVSVTINKFTSMSFFNYVNSWRIKEAVDILSDPKDDTPLKSVCDKVGYSSLTSFYRVFQKETGCTPSVYRKKIRSGQSENSDDSMHEE